MRVLYVSKASRVAAHREKLRVLAGLHDVTLVIPAQWGDARYEVAAFDDAYRVVELPALLHGHNHLHAYRGLGRILETGAFDLVHVDEEPYSLVTAQLARLAGRRAVPFVFFAWQNLHKRLPPPFGSLRRQVFARAAGGIAGSSAAADVVRAAGFRGPLLVSPQMGVSVERFGPDPAARLARRAELRVEPDARLVGFVGRVVPEKGVDVLVRAMRDVPEAHLVLVGDGVGVRGRGRPAEGSRTVGRVHAVGAVPSLDVPRWMAAFDVLALPSLTTPRWAEQFGRVLVEAMASRVPVVVSDSGAMAEVVGDAGVVVPEGSAEALAHALTRLLSDGEAREHLGRVGRERVLAHFTNERVVHAQTGFYERVLEARSGVDPAEAGAGPGTGRPT